MNDERIIEACAGAAHEVNRQYSIAIDDRPAGWHWEYAPEWQRESVRSGVVGILKGNSPQQSHANWLAEKLAAGWKWGRVKNPKTKEHPCMKPYNELAPAQQAKDWLFFWTVRAVSRALSIADGQPHEADEADVLRIALAIQADKLETLVKAALRVCDDLFVDEEEPVGQKLLNELHEAAQNASAAMLAGSAILSSSKDQGQ
jgi:hypothetical protein